jgi:signal transduction histidine kinase
MFLLRKVRAGPLAPRIGPALAIRRPTVPLVRPPDAPVLTVVAAAWREARPVVQLVFLLRFLCGGALVPGFAVSGRFVVGALSWCLVVAGIYLCNGAADVVEDRHNGSSRPVASGALPARTAAAAALALAAAGVFLAAVHGRTLMVLALAMATFGWAYSTGPRPMKRSVGGFVAVVVSGGALTYWAGSVVAGGAFQPRLLCFAASMSLWMGLAGWTKDLSDAAGDAAAGRRTLPVLLGHRRAAGVMALGALGVAVAFLGILGEVLAGPENEPLASATELSAEIGTSRAAMQVPPAESLYAASVLFEVALPVLAKTLDGRAGGALELALTLQQSIMRRVGLASVAYVNFLLQRLQICQHEERRRVARELHDRPAHGLGVGLQSLELHDLYASTDPRRAATRLLVARDAVREALETIKTIAANLRDSLGQRSLDEALTAYLEEAAPPDIDTSVEVAGRLEAVPAAVSEEVYLVLREALHNALLHAGPAALDVAVTVEGSALRAEVTDDGSGFDPTTRSEGIGLASMRERVELLGGSVDVSSGIGRGTRVRALIPLSTMS